MFTKEELELIVQFISNTPVHGTLITLPKSLELMLSVVRKCNEQLQRIKEAEDSHVESS